jgi:hypothetical protein
MSQNQTGLRKWSQEEEAVIFKYIQQFPTASQAFKAASEELVNRSAGSISGHYYDLIGKNKSKKKPRKYNQHIEIGNGNGNGQQNGTMHHDHSKAIVPYSANKKNQLPVYDDTEVFETILILIPKLNPGRKLQLVQHLFS